MTDDVDRLGIGMLYAGGAGIMIGYSAEPVHPAAGPFLAATVIAVALAYDGYNRYKAQPEP